MEQQGNPPEQTQPGTPTRVSSPNPNVVGVHFKLGKKIGEGSFGIIYQGSIIY